MFQFLTTIFVGITLLMGGVFGYEKINQELIGHKHLIRVLNEKQEEIEKKFLLTTDSLDAKLGAAITNIAATDTLRDSRSTINTNFTNLNTDKIEVSTTTVGNITSLPNLATIGTITTGVWNGTVIGVAYNGTGTTSPTTNQVMLGNGSSGFKVVNGFGTSGQFLTSQGVSTAPTWTTSAVSLTDSYAWTGLHTFTATTTISRLDVTGGLARFNGVDYGFPSLIGAAGDVLTIDRLSSTTLKWTPPATSTVSVVLRPSSGAIETADVVVSTNTIMSCGKFILPFVMTVNKISLNFAGVSGASTLDIGVYSQDGLNKLIDVTTSSTSTPGAISTAVSAVRLTPADYWACVIPNGTSNVTLSMWSAGNTTAIRRISYDVDGPNLDGIITGLSAGTLPATFATSSLTFAAGSEGNNAPIIRFDN